MEKTPTKSRNKKSVIEHPADAWSFLPHELVRYLLSNMNAESLYNCTFLCKSWSQVARDKKLIKIAYNNSKEFSDMLFKLKLKLGPKKFKSIMKNEKLIKFLKIYHKHSFRMLKFLSSNFSHDSGIVNEDALRALIYISWFSGDIVDIIEQLILEAMEQLKVYVTLENTPKDTGNSLASDARFFILKRNSLENLTIIFFQRMVAKRFTSVILEPHVEKIMNSYDTLSVTKEEGINNIMPLLKSLFDSIVQSAPLFPQELSKIYSFYEDNVQKLAVDKEKIQRGVLTSRLLILRLFVPCIINFAKKKEMRTDRLSLYAQIANVINEISALATNDSSMAVLDKRKAPAILEFCQERVGAMSDYLQQVMTSTKEKETEIRSEPDARKVIEKATFVLKLWEGAKSKLETSLKVQHKDIYDEYKFLEESQKNFLN